MGLSITVCTSPTASWGWVSGSERPDTVPFLLEIAQVHSRGTVEPLPSAQREPRAGWTRLQAAGQEGGKGVGSSPTAHREQGGEGTGQRHLGKHGQTAQWGRLRLYE